MQVGTACPASAIWQRCECLSVQGQLPMDDWLRALRACPDLQGLALLYPATSPPPAHRCADVAPHFPAALVLRLTGVCDILVDRCEPFTLVHDPEAITCRRWHGIAQRSPADLVLRLMDVDDISINRCSPFSAKLSLFSL